MWEIDQSDQLDQSDLPDFCRKATVVFGVGNILFGDDGFGCAVIDYVEAHYRVPEAVCLLDVGTSVRKLLFTLCLSTARPERLLIVDAIDAGRTPGEIFEIDPAEIPPVKLDDFSLHQLPTSNLLRELQETWSRGAGAGLPNRATAGRNLPGFVESSQRRRATSSGVARRRVFPQRHSTARRSMPNNVLKTPVRARHIVRNIFSAPCEQAGDIV